jgi:hypothetical protein
METARPVWIPNATTTLILLVIGFAVGFLVTYYRYESKIAECDDYAASVPIASRQGQALAFAECFRPKKYDYRPR